MSQTPATAIIYCRVSSPDQLQGTSLDSQERICREYADRQGVSVLRTFIEQGESAKTANRTELTKAIKFTKQQRVDVFIVYKLDRFARSVYDHVTVRAILRRHGTELRSATEPIDDSPIGRFMEAQMSAVAELDNNMRRERTTEGMRQRIRQGMWVWPAPLGYMRPHKGANIVPDPKTAPLIRFAFEKYAEGIHTYKAIVEMLVVRGLRSRYGNTLRFQEIAKLLHNPIYAGIIEAWGQKVPGSFVPIVSYDLFQRCQPEGETPRPHAAPRSLNNPLFPLRRLIVCSTCGEGITGSCSTGRRGTRYPYYHHRAQRCPSALYHRKSDLEARFVTLLEGLRPTAKAKAAFRSIVLDHWRESRTSTATERTRIKRELAKLTAQRQRVFEYHRIGAYANEDFQEQKSILDLQIQQKNRLLAEDVDAPFELESALDLALGYLDEPARKWIELEPTYDERLRYQRQIFRDVLTFDGSEFGTPKLSCVHELILRSEASNSSLVAQVRASWNHIVSEFRACSGDIPPPATTLGRNPRFRS